MLKFITRNWQMSVLILFSVFVFFFRLGEGALYDWDEANYAGVAQEIVKSGDWLNLTFNKEYWPMKPPLVIWGMAVGFNVFGISEWSARFFTAAFGVLLTVFVSVLVSTVYKNKFIGFASGILFLGTLHFLKFSRMGMMDVPMTFFISCAVISFYFAKQNSKLFLLTGLFTGLSVMTKGVIGFFPIPILFIYCIFSGYWNFFKEKNFYYAILILFAVILPWHIYQIIEHGHVFIDYYFIYNLFGRSLETIEGHTGTVFYYFNYMFIYYTQFWVNLSSVLLVIWIYLNFRKKTWTNYRILLFVWFGFIMLLFTVSKSKLHWYIVPAYIPLLLIFIDSVQMIFSEKVKRISLSVLSSLTVLHIFILFFIGELTFNSTMDTKKLGLKSKEYPEDNIITYDVNPNAPAFYSEKKFITVYSAEEILNYTDNSLILTTSDLAESVKNIVPEYSVVAKEKNKVLMRKMNE